MDVQDGKDEEALATPAPPSAESTAGIQGRVDQLLSRIDAAAERSGRDPAAITVLLATKTRTPAQIAEAVRCVRERGRTVVVGENRAQEIAKHGQGPLAGLEVPRHFIGRLQTNKAKDAIAFASVIHSVDREAIIDALVRRAELADVHRDVLVQVNTSGEESKGGFAPEPSALAPALERIASSGRLRPIGLMTIGANTPDEESVRSSLALLRRLRDQIGMPGVTELSMGMSADLEIAVDEGATIVRPGSAVFGPRPA